MALGTGQRDRMAARHVALWVLDPASGRGMTVGECVGIRGRNWEETGESGRGTGMPPLPHLVKRRAHPRHPAPRRGIQLPDGQRIGSPAGWAWGTEATRQNGGGYTAAATAGWAWGTGQRDRMAQHHVALWMLDPAAGRGMTGEGTWDDCGRERGMTVGGNGGGTGKNGSGTGVERGETMDAATPPLREAQSAPTSSRATTRDPAARRAMHWQPLRAGHGARRRRDRMVARHVPLWVLDPASGRGMTGENAWECGGGTGEKAWESAG